MTTRNTVGKAALWQLSRSRSTDDGVAQLREPPRSVPAGAASRRSREAHSAVHRPPQRRKVGRDEGQRRAGSSRGCPSAGRSYSPSVRPAHQAEDQPCFLRLDGSGRQIWEVPARTRSEGERRRPTFPLSAEGLRAPTVGSSPRLVGLRTSPMAENPEALSTKYESVEEHAPPSARAAAVERSVWPFPHRDATTERRIQDRQLFTPRYSGSGNVT